jgi:hypothetical protein
MSQCNYCNDDATYKDNVWGPTQIYCCENKGCLNMAKHDLFACAMEDCS